MFNTVRRSTGLALALLAFAGASFAGLADAAPKHHHHHHRHHPVHHHPAH